MIDDIVNDPKISPEIKGGLSTMRGTLISALIMIGGFKALELLLNKAFARDGAARQAFQNAMAKNVKSRVSDAQWAKQNPEHFDLLAPEAREELIQRTDPGALNKGAVLAGGINRYVDYKLAATPGTEENALFIDGVKKAAAPQFQWEEDPAKLEWLNKAAQSLPSLK